MTTIDDRLTIDLWLSLWIVVKNNGSKSRLGDETLWKKGKPWDLAKNWISLQPINIFPGEKKILGAKIPLWLPKYCIFQAKQPQILSHHKTNRNNSTTAKMTTIPTITNCRQTTIMTSIYRPVQCVPLLLHRQRGAEKPQQLQRNSNLPFARSWCHSWYLVNTITTVGSVLFQAGVLFSVLSKWWWWWWWSTFLACLVRSSGSSTNRIIVAVSSSSSWASLGGIRLGWSLSLSSEHWSWPSS